MAYQIKNDKSLAAEVRRIATAETRAAMTAARRTRAISDAVHAVRSHCKRTRALLRLVHTGLGDRYRIENHAFRDIARRLSTFRDADVMRASLIETIENASSEGSTGDFEALRQRLAAERARRRLEHATLAALSLAQESLSICLERVGGWRLKGKRARIVCAGLSATYEEAQALMHAAASTGDAHQFHEWRKHVKHHWLQLRLIRPISSQLYPGRTKRMSELSHVLGALHDFDVLEDWLRRVGRRERAARALVRVIEQRRSSLKESALTLSAPLFERPPEAFARPVGRRWNP